ncbi:MAG: AsmA family protein [Odoribacteraceae bacterium]|jgi:uncharacterized protein involved in outer membrane biogenesis|nr:AsmA family protein [Odoribacteraceae bacterium]
MKKVIVITLSLLVGVIGILIAIPFFFKEDVLRLIERQSSKYIRGQLVIGDMKISMFRNFPNLSVTLTDVQLSGTGGEAADTLVLVPRFEASVNLKSLVWGNEIIVNHLLLKDARLALQVNAAGNSNWDILLPPTDTLATKTEGKRDEDDSSIRLSHIAIENLSCVYDDIPAALHAGAEKISLRLQGNFSETNTLLALGLHVENTSLWVANTAWLTHLHLDWNTEIQANLRDFIFEIRKSDLSLNDLKLDFAGSVGLADDRLLLDLALNAPDTRFESLLALLPEKFRSLLDGINTTGEFKLHATARGEYHGDHLPAVDLQFGIMNASLQYPNLPESIEAINLELHVSHPGGSLVATNIDLSKLLFRVANNPFEMRLNVTNLADPRLNGMVKGILHFESLKRALPLAKITLEGTLAADLSFDGKYAYIEQEEYEKFSARGHLSLKEVLFKNDRFPGGIAISSGEMKITPSRLDLSNLQLKVNSSDVRLEGHLSNYLSYLLKGQALKGDFVLSSSLLNLNELYGGASAGATTTSDTTTGVIAVPKNLQLGLDARVGTLLFDDLVIQNIRGNVRTNDGIATLKEMSLDLLNGKILLGGSYNTVNIQKPTVDFDVNASAIDLDEAYKAFSFIRASLPVAVHCQGKVSAVMRFAAGLDREMCPEITTMSGGGTLSASDILVNDNPALDELAALLHNEELSRLRISDLKIAFKMEQGNITVEPFTTKLAGQQVTMYGVQGATGAMDYTLSVTVPREHFGKEIEKLLAPIPGSARIKSVDIDVKIGGTLHKPTFTLDLSKVRKVVEKALKEQVEESIQKEIIKGIDKLFKRK